MHSTPPPPRRRWDGSHTDVRTRRSLRVTSDGVSRLLRCGQNDRCRDCDNRIEWYHRSDSRPIRLHPQELPTSRVPVTCRWHVSSGVAYPSDDGTRWCRLPHAAVCPTRETTPARPELVALRRALALNTRRLLDVGALTPSSTASDAEVPAPVTCRPNRPIVQLLYIRYLAAQPVDEIRCVAQTRRRDRCGNPLLAPEASAGIWALMPTMGAHGQLALPAEAMAVYDLTGLPYGEQLRWRAQRCPQHADAPTAGDMAVAEWEVFDPLLHHEHIYSRLPTVVRRTGPSVTCRRADQP
ncbi:DUF6083 domain-containing protein [Streptomyces phaeochromogenes]